MASPHCSNQGQQPLPVGGDGSTPEPANGGYAPSSEEPTTWDSFLAAVARASPIAPVRILSAGSVAGEYRIESVLGQGGFGTVYRAVHPIIGKAVAVKVLHEQFCTNSAVVTRFVEEGCAVNRIAHPNIVDIFGFGTLETGQQYLVMELLEGESLRKRLRRDGAVEPAETLQLLRGVASALDATHDQKILHRDLKPENIFLVRRDAEGLRPKLLDFGIAKVLNEPGGSTTGDTHGRVLGTRAYMSPEQCVGAAVDARTDIYALGIIAYEMLTGVHPFETETVARSDVRSRSCGVSPSEQNTALPQAIDGPLCRLFALDPEQRPTRASTAIETLAAAFGNDALPTRRTPEGRLRVWVVAMAGIVGAVFAIYGWRAWSVERHPADRFGVVSGGESVLRTTLVPVVGSPSAGVAPAPAERQPSLIAVALDVSPTQAEAYVDGRLVPRHQGVLQLERGPHLVTLLVRAPGYVDKTVEITPEQDLRLHVRLSRIANPRRVGSQSTNVAPRSRELEF